MAAATGASLRELMERMGHTSTRAALIYQHATRERDEAIAAANLEGLSERQATVRRMQSPTCEILSCLDLGTMASEDLCSEGGHSSGRLSEAS